MSLLDYLVPVSVPDTLKSISNLYTTDKEKIKAQTELAKVLMQDDAKQIDLNKLYANSTSIFMSGWRPLLAWTCGFCIALYYLPLIAITTLIWAINSFKDYSVMPYPIMPADILNLIYLLLGFGAYRMIEKKF